jgi:hypothetical protein
VQLYGLGEGFEALFSFKLSQAVDEASRNPSAWVTQGACSGAE